VRNSATGRWRAWIALAALGLAAGSAAAYDLADIRSRGLMRVAVYKEFPPFYDEGKGISVDLASALAAKLGVRLSLMPFDADESADDDLRNMVWKGHYLGYGPADAMLHVPVDRAFMERNDKVRIFAPYFREKIQLVRDVRRLPQLDSLAALASETIGVEGSTLAHTVLLGVDGGRLRGNVRQFKSTGEALAELRAGRLAAVMGLRSELQAGVKDVPGFEITDPAVPGLPPAGWILGLAVKSENEDLARALQQAMNELAAEGEVGRIFERYGVPRLAP
jgi:ABC-type amino acid transport substrate-binding protein